MYTIFSLLTPPSYMLCTHHDLLYHIYCFQFPVAYMLQKNIYIHNCKCIYIKLKKKLIIYTKQKPQMLSQEINTVQYSTFKITFSCQWQSRCFVFFLSACTYFCTTAAQKKLTKLECIKFFFPFTDHYFIFISIRCLPYLTAKASNISLIKGSTMVLLKILNIISQSHHHSYNTHVDIYTHLKLELK